MNIELYQVDAFTKELFSGNPAGVVTNADNLDGDTMQKIAREMNLSETAFIINRSTDEYDIEVRFFTPTNEVPICGHATISAHYVYAKKHGLKSGIIKQKTKAGILPVEIVEDGDDIKIIMTQGKIEYGKILNSDQKNLLTRGLGIKNNQFISDLPIQIVTTGHSKVMVPIKSKDLLDKMVINESLLSQLSRDIKCNGFYVFTFDSKEENILTSGRMFAPVIGINEDPVTGNANGPLGAYLMKNNIIKPENPYSKFTIKQGEVIGRKGIMDVYVYSENREPYKIKISGNARVVFKTSLNI